MIRPPPHRPGRPADRARATRGLRRHRARRVRARHRARPAAATTSRRSRRATRTCPGRSSRPFPRRSGRPATGATRRRFMLATMLEVLDHATRVRRHPQPPRVVERDPCPGHVGARRGDVPRPARPALGARRCWRRRRRPVSWRSANPRPSATPTSPWTIVHNGLTLDGRAVRAPPVGRPLLRRPGRPRRRGSSRRSRSPQRRGRRLRIAAKVGPTPARARLQRERLPAGPQGGRVVGRVPRRAVRRRPRRALRRELRGR